MTWMPERAIEIVAGTPPGGGLDRSARALLHSIESNGLVDVPVRVVNVGGDGGRKAWVHMDTRSGDGHVISISSPNMAAASGCRFRRLRRLSSRRRAHSPCSSRVAAGSP